MKNKAIKFLAYNKKVSVMCIDTTKLVKVDNATRVLSILPLHHTYECTIGYLLVVYGGGTICYCKIP